MEIARRQKFSEKFQCVNPVLNQPVGVRFRGKIRRKWVSVYGREREGVGVRVRQCSQGREKLT